MTTKLHDLLFEKYMEYQRALGERRSLKEFSEHIGIGQVHLNRLMNDRRNAGEKTIQQLAEFFGDPRFYDVVGMDRPEKFLTYTRRNWGTVPDEVKKKIAEEVSRYATEPVPKEDE